MLERLAREWRSRGAAAFFVWLLPQFVRRRSHVLFALDLSDVQLDVPLPDIVSVEIHSHNFDRLGRLRARLGEINAENIDYLDDVRRGDAIALVLLDGDDVVHYAFVLLRNKTACLLGLGKGSALIGNAYTVPSHRGRGLQAHSARCRARIARDAGFQSIVCETGPDNRASQRGLEKAGMRPIGEMQLLVLLNCLVVRWRRPTGFPLFGLCI